MWLAREVTRSDFVFHELRGVLAKSHHRWPLAPTRLPCPNPLSLRDEPGQGSGRIGLVSERAEDRDRLPSPSADAFGSTSIEPAPCERTAVPSETSPASLGSASGRFTRPSLPQSFSNRPRNRLRGRADFSRCRRGSSPFTRRAFLEPTWCSQLSEPSSARHSRAAPQDPTAVGWGA